MSIIRSNIARQLLAEGGAPRASFRSGGGRTDANTMSGSGYGAGSSSTDYSSFGLDQEDDNARMMRDMGLTGPGFTSRGGGENPPSLIDRVLGRTTSGINTLRDRLGNRFDRTKNY